MFRGFCLAQIRNNIDTIQNISNTMKLLFSVYSARSLFEQSNALTGYCFVIYMYVHSPGYSFSDSPIINLALNIYFSTMYA